MRFICKLTIKLLCSLLFLILCGLGIGYSTIVVLGNSKPLEQALDKSGIYNTETHFAITENQISNLDGIPLNTPAIQTAFEKAFPPSLLEQETNNVLDGSYLWIRGKTAAPDFQIDLLPAKNNLAVYIAQYAQNRASGLPKCTFKELLSNGMAVDPYTATCLPPGITPAIVANQVKQQILSSTILNNPVLNAKTLKLNNQTIPQQFKILPKAYDWIHKGIYISLAAAIAISLGIVLLTPDRTKGLSRLGTVIWWAGLVSIVTAEIISIGIGQIITRINSAGKINQPLLSELTSLMKSLIYDYHNCLLIYGVILVIIGGGTWIIIKFWPFRKRTVSDAVIQKSK